MYETSHGFMNAPVFRAAIREWHPPSCADGCELVIDIAEEGMPAQITFLDHLHEFRVTVTNLFAQAISQYASRNYQQLLAEHGLRASMGRKGNLLG